MTPKGPGVWDWDGQCRPGATAGGYHTFSVGIFQWIPKKGGRGLRGELKRGKVVQRVRGSVFHPQEVYDKAAAICAELNGE